MHWPNSVEHTPTATPPHPTLLIRLCAGLMVSAIVVFAAGFVFEARFKALMVWFAAHSIDSR